jgi:hypothetical protein
MPVKVFFHPDEDGEEYDDEDCDHEEQPEDEDEHDVVSLVFAADALSEDESYDKGDEYDDKKDELVFLM